MKEQRIFFYKNRTSNEKCSMQKNVMQGSLYAWSHTGTGTVEYTHKIIIIYSTTHYAYFQKHKCVCTTNFVCVRVFKENLRFSIKILFQKLFSFLKKRCAMAHPSRHHHHIIKLVIIQKQLFHKSSALETFLRLDIKTRM